MDQSSIERKLTVILAADVAGYSRLMGEAEAATILKPFPKFSLATYGGALTYSDPAQTEHALDALRTAGLPE